MQLVEFQKWPNMPADWVKCGDWLDTIAFPGDVMVRFKPERYSGPALMVRKVATCSFALITLSHSHHFYP